MREAFIPAGKVHKDTHEYTVENLLEGYSYFIRVSALNEVGIGDFAETIDAIKCKLPYGGLMLF